MEPQMKLLRVSANINRLASHVLTRYGIAGSFTTQSRYSEYPKQFPGPFENTLVIVQSYYMTSNLVCVCREEETFHKACKSDHTSRKAQTLNMNWGTLKKFTKEIKLLFK